MKRLWFLLLLIPLGFVVWLLLKPAEQPPQQARAFLKDGTEVAGQVIEKEYGKFIVIKTDENNQQVITWDQLKYINEPNEVWYWSILVGFWNLLPQLAVAAGLVAFFSGLWQYRDAQKWKRNEFIVKELGEYEANPYISNAQSILDATGLPVELQPSSADGTVTSAVADGNTLSRALAPPDPANPFTPVEIKIRDSFDVFLSNLERFNNFIDSGLVRKKEIKIYLSYWLKIMGDPTNTKISTEARNQLWNYIKANDYPGVIHLLNKFGYNVE